MVIKGDGADLRLGYFGCMRGDDNAIWDRVEGDPGVIATIVDTISRAKGASIDEIVEVLVKTFPVMLMA